jgi:hypothetical protein
VSSRLSIAPRGTYFGKLLEEAKMDGCKPSFSARQRKLLSISPQYINILHIIKVYYYKEVFSWPFIGPRGINFG